MARGLVRPHHLKLTGITLEIIVVVHDYDPVPLGQGAPAITLAEGEGDPVWGSFKIALLTILNPKLVARRV